MSKPLNIYAVAVEALQAREQWIEEGLVIGASYLGDDLLAEHERRSGEQQIEELHVDLERVQTALAAFEELAETFGEIECAEMRQSSADVENWVAVRTKHTEDGRIWATASGIRNPGSGWLTMSDGAGWGWTAWQVVLRQGLCKIAAVFEMRRRNDAEGFTGLSDRPLPPEERDRYRLDGKGMQS